MVDEKELQFAFSKILRKLRKNKELSQEQLAVKAGIARSTISSIERNYRSPTGYSLFALAEGLGMAVEDLVKEVRLAIK